MSTTERACPLCGSRVSLDARFCRVCGAVLPEPVPVTAGVPSEIFAQHVPEPEVAAAPARATVPWRGVEALAVFFLHLLVTAIVVVPVILLLKDQDAATSIAIAVSEAALLTTALVWARLVHGSRPRDLGLRKLTWANIGIGVGIGVAGVIVAGMVSALVTTVVEAISDSPVTEPEQIPLEGDPGAALLVIIGFSVMILAPLAEETFFRGFLYPSLRRWARPWPAVLLSAAIFAVVHVIPLVIPPIFVLGIALAWLTEWRRSIVPAIVTHMVFNTVGFVTLVTSGQL